MQKTIEQQVKSRIAYGKYGEVSTNLWGEKLAV